MAPRLDKLARWLEREEWSELFDEWLDLHCGTACRDAGIELSELAGRIGEAGVGMATDCAFQDFLSVLDEEGLSFAEHYLKRRGFGESRGNQNYIRAIEASAISLYEITAVTPGVSFEARDRLRGDAVVLLQERRASHDLEVGLIVAARQIRFLNQDEVAGAILVFEYEDPEGFIATFQGILNSSDLFDEDEDELAAARSPTDEPRLRALAPLITNAWVSQELAFSDEEGLGAANE
jgi:hypothetical protein